MFEHLRGQVAVVRQKHQPRRRVFQIPHRVHPRRKTAQTILQRLAPFRIRHGRNHFRRLVQHQIHAPLRLLHHAPRRLNPVLLRVRFGSQLRHHAPVHPHLSAQDQLLRVPPRSNPRPRNNLLQSLLHVLGFSFQCGLLVPQFAKAWLCATICQFRACLLKQAERGICLSLLCDLCDLCVKKTRPNSRVATVSLSCSPSSTCPEFRFSCFEFRLCLTPLPPPSSPNSHSPAFPHYSPPFLLTTLPSPPLPLAP